MLDRLGPRSHGQKEDQGEKSTRAEHDGAVAAC